MVTYSIMTRRSRKTFEELIALPDLGIPIAEAALLLACEEYPHLSLSPYLRQLDDIAGDVDNRLNGTKSALDKIHTINEVLFDEYGFHRNDIDYYDPRNSFLNEVMDRRTGIPITLSTVYMEIAQRVGLQIDGVGVPGHFIVKHVSEIEEIFVDPFNAGTIMTRADCHKLIRELNVKNIQDEHHWLQRVTHRQILSRMLNNLKVIYINQSAFDKALIMLGLMLLTVPSEAVLYKERGLLQLQQRQFNKAAKDLEQYLKLSSGAKDREEIQNYLQDIRRIRAMMN